MSIALEQEPCENAISRNAVDELSRVLVHTTRDKADFLCNFWEELQKLPSVTPQQKIGHWTRELIRNEKGGCIGAKMICSECGKDNKYDEYMNYCPNCGAKMVEPQAESEG